MVNEHFLDHSDGCDRMTILLDQKEVLLEVDSVVLMRLHLTQILVALSSDEPVGIIVYFQELPSPP